MNKRILLSGLLFEKVISFLRTSFSLSALLLVHRSVQVSAHASVSAMLGRTSRRYAGNRKRQDRGGYRIESSCMWLATPPHIPIRLTQRRFRCQPCGPDRIPAVLQTVVHVQGPARLHWAWEEAKARWTPAHTRTHLSTHTSTSPPAKTHH